MLCYGKKDCDSICTELSSALVSSTSLNYVLNCLRTQFYHYFIYWCWQIIIFCQNYVTVCTYIKTNNHFSGQKKCRFIFQPLAVDRCLKSSKEFVFAVLILLHSSLMSLLVSIKIESWRPIGKHVVVVTDKRIGNLKSLFRRCQSNKTTCRPKALEKMAIQWFDWHPRPIQTSLYDTLERWVVGWVEQEYSALFRTDIPLDEVVKNMSNCIN